MTPTENKNPEPNVKPQGEPKPEPPKVDQYVVLDLESNAVEYGPSPDKEAGEAHFHKQVALDVRGTLSDTVGRKLGFFKLTPVKVGDPKDLPYHVATEEGKLFEVDPDTKKL